MQESYPNIYKKARSDCGLTQERAAEVLHLSVESVKAYETGQRVPPDQTVTAMAEAYDWPWLLLEHAQRTDRLGLVPEGAEPRPLPLVAIQLYNRMLDFAERHRGRQLLEIAADGVIDEAERPVLDEIVCELEGISAAWLTLRCAGAKKDRPKSGHLERSALSKTENYRELLYHNPAKTQAPFSHESGVRA